ncbi:MAG TPA: histidine phosphatase family protein [Opitutaceae bacterium]
MTITLIRHGRPLADFSTKRRGDALGEWLRVYEGVTVDTSLPPPEALRVALRGTRVFSSPVPRARSSAALLSAEMEMLDDAREAPLPERVWCPLRVRPATLLALARTAWFLGAAAGERPAAVRVRARRMAEVLLDAAREMGEAGAVALVGHGYMNRFIATELRGLGWRRTAMDGMGYWGAMRFEK